MHKYINLSKTGQDAGTDASKKNTKRLPKRRKILYADSKMTGKEDDESKNVRCPYIKRLRRKKSKAPKHFSLRY